MKKILALILTILMVFALFTSCGSGKNSNEEKNDKNENEILNNDKGDLNDSNGDNDHPKDVYGSTEGLDFKLNDDRKSYTLIGVGSSDSNEIIINKYNQSKIIKDKNE